jgi:hypothetical protein
MAGPEKRFNQNRRMAGAALFFPAKPRTHYEVMY